MFIGLIFVLIFIIGCSQYLGETKGLGVASSSIYDVNGDGNVDNEDFFLFSSYFGTSLNGGVNDAGVGYDAKYDFDGNGVIDNDDFFLLTDNMRGGVDKEAAKKQALSVSELKSSGLKYKEVDILKDTFFENLNIYSGNAAIDCGDEHIFEYTPYYYCEGGEEAYACKQDTAFNGMKTNEFTNYLFSFNGYGESCGKDMCPGKEKKGLLFIKCGFSEMGMKPGVVTTDGKAGEGEWVAQIKCSSGKVIKEWEAYLYNPDNAGRRAQCISVKKGKIGDSSLQVFVGPGSCGKGKVYDEIGTYKPRFKSNVICG